jgi:FAD/FMN-containing dehydrogenase
MSTKATLADEARLALAGDFNGILIGPADPAYDDARALYNAMIDRRPAVIAVCSSASDVTAAIGFARSRGAAIAVRCGGHNGAGLGSVDGGVVVDLSGLKDITVDGVAMTVRVGGGCLWREVDAATHEAGGAVPCGVVGSTGVGGLTLGGGIGHLSRSGGLTIDNVLEAEVVLADGSIVRAAPDENPDLFWALRGGGGNFGVVTAFTFRMQPVSTVIAGPTFWDIEDTPAILTAYRDFITTAPRELNGWFAFVTVPPAPPFPVELHGRKVAAIVWSYTGDEEAAAAAMAPMLEVAAPLIHAVGPMPMPVLNTFFDPLFPPGHQWYWRADFIRELSDDAVARNLKFGRAMPTPQSTMHLYPINGAVHDVPAEDTAFRYRDVTWAQVIVGVDPDPAEAERLKRWTVEYWEAIHPESAGGAYVNFLMDEGQERVQATYGENYGRLAQVKAKYDPDNAFRINQNVQPASPS